MSDVPPVPPEDAASPPPEPLFRPAPPEEAAGAPPELLFQPAPAASAPAPPLPPLTRIAVYIAACIGASAAGCMPAILLATVRLSPMLRAGGTMPDVRAAMSGDVLILGMAGVYPLTILTTWLFTRYVDQARPADIGLALRPGWGRALAAGAALGTPVVVASALLYARLGWVRLSAAPVSVPRVVLSTLLISAAVGLTEEMVFRGYLMKNLEEWRGRRAAIAGTTMLFWLAHLNQGNNLSLIGAADMLATALALGLARCGSGALWFPIGLHASYDLSAIGLAGAPEMGLPGICRQMPLAPAWLVGGPGIAGAADLVVALMVLAVVYLFVYRPRLKGDARVAAWPEEAESEAPMP